MELEVSERTRKAVWDGIGRKSARKIAEETGLSPEEVFAIKRDLLDGVDELSVQENRQKLLIQLQDIATDAYESFKNATDERNKAGLLNSALSGIDKALKELGRVSKAEQDRIDTLNGLRVRELLRLIDTTVARTLEEIADIHGLDEEELLGIFQKFLRPVADEMDRT